MWEWIRADTMEDWKKKTPVERDAPTKEAEGAQYTVWEAMLEMEPYEAEAGPRNPGAVAVLMDLKQAFEKSAIASNSQFYSYDAMWVLCTPEKRSV